MKKVIAVVDDEPDILHLLEVNLDRSGFKTVCFEDGTSLLEYLKKDEPDLIVLDLMLPDYDGFDICRIIRTKQSTSHIPIIMFSARGESLDKILGLELGADDYLDKMSSPRELIARIKAVFRRGKHSIETAVIKLNEHITIDPQKYQILVSNKKIKVTTTEFNILHLLAMHPGWVYSRNQILDHLWGNDKIVIDRTIDVHIRNLREKLGDAGKIIKNVRGVGYKLEL
ncbi:MAG: response regulator transcription factor [Candidatus Cloacimonetes bacterium]|nr:response regulator transcription factor [Candidatus Cloacimonadota bacterium]